MDQAKLIELAKQGDRAAFEGLVRSLHQRVYWTAYQVVGRHEDAQDIAQTAFVRLWKVLPKYDEKYTFSTWLYRIVMNLAIDHVRREARHQHEDEPHADGAWAVDRSAVSPHETASRQELQSVFRELAAELPPQQRAVFVLRELEERSTEEVTEILEISASTVRNHLFQARKALRVALQSRYPELLPPSQRGGSN